MVMAEATTTLSSRATGGTERVKKTDIGTMPADWDVVPLSMVGESLIGLTYHPSDVRSDGTLVLRSSNIQDGRLSFDDNVFVQMDVPDRVLVKPGDILICVRNGSRELIGKCAYIDASAEGMAFGAFMGVFRSEINPFLFRVIESELFRRQVRQHLGATINQITNKSLNGFLVPLPPTKEERNAIADALSDIDDLIIALEAMIAKKRAIKQGSMEELFSRARRLPGFGGAWEMKRLGEVGKCLRGVSYRGDADLFPHDTYRTTRLLRSNNVQDSGVVTNDVQFVNSSRVAEHQLLEEGDILICMANGSKALVGKAGYFDVADGFDYTFGAFMGVFRVTGDMANRRFTSYLFQSWKYRECIANLLAGSSINNLAPSSIESLEFDVPTIKEQTAIAEVLSDMDSELAALVGKLAKARQIKQGMMRELLTGRIRLV
jgi:type I restriction enzyme, S subunit